MFTLWVLVNVPVAGVITGVAVVGKLMVKAELATALFLKPGAIASAFTVVVTLI
jgi:hypothetical protein